MRHEPFVAKQSKRRQATHQRQDAVDRHLATGGAADEAGTMIGSGG